MQIVDIQLRAVAERLSKKGISFEITQDAKNLLIDEGYDPNYGARPLKRVIQNKILNSLAEMLVGGKISEGASISIGVKNGAFSFDSRAKVRIKKQKRELAGSKNS